MMPSTEDAAGGRGGLSGVEPAPAPRGSPAAELRRGWRKERMDCCCCCRRGCIAVAGRGTGSLEVESALAVEAGERARGEWEGRGRGKEVDEIILGEFASGK